MIIVSILSAFLAGMGIGGGALFVILSTLFLNFDQKYAQALNLLLFIAVSASATFSNIKDKKIDFNITKKLIAFLIVGSLIGSFFADKINSNSLKNIFSYFLVSIGIYEIITSLKRIIQAKNNTSKNRKES